MTSTPDTHLKTIYKLFSDISAITNITITLYTYPEYRQIFHTTGCNVCSTFHRQGGFTKNNCINFHNAKFFQAHQNNEIQVFNCDNGLTLAFTTIECDDNQKFILELSQLLTEELNTEFFFELARNNNMDEKEYFEALNNIPVFSDEKLTDIYKHLANILIHCYENQREISSERQMNIQQLNTKNEELKKTIEKLENTKLFLLNAQNYKNRFISNLSHEVRTPLNAITGFTDILRLQYFGEVNDKQAEYLTLIQQSSKQLLSLIDDLICITKLHSDSIELKIESFPIQPFVNEIYSLMAVQFNEKKICFARLIDDKCHLMTSDKIKCSEILLHFLSNALKFTDPGGKVILKADMIEDDKIAFAVTDTGIGIEEQDYEKVFEEFYQNESLQQKSPGGIGIGLTLCKHLTSLLGGTIEVKSKPGKGSTFKVILPIHCKNHQ
jgi:signal transduction histidine kinase